MNFYQGLYSLLMDQSCQMKFLEITISADINAHSIHSYNMCPAWLVLHIKHI